MIPWTLTIKGYCEQLSDQNFIRLNGAFFEWYNQDIYKMKRILYAGKIVYYRTNKITNKTNKSGQHLETYIFPKETHRCMKNGQ